MTGIHQALAAGTVSGNLLDIINKLGLTSNLNLVLDAGDPQSYSGSGQTWSDRSGSGNNYVRGSTTGTEEIDPTFVQGGRFGSSYWVFDSASQYQRFQEASAHTYTNAWIKSGATYTIACAVFPKTSNTKRSTLFNNRGGNNSNNFYNGIELAIALNDNGRRITLAYSTNNQGTFHAATTGINVAIDQWNFIAATFSSSAGTYATQVNGSYQALTGQPATTGTSDPDGTNAIGLMVPEPNTGFMQLNERIAFMAHWSRALSSSELQSFYNLVKPRFSGMP